MAKYELVTALMSPIRILSLKERQDDDVKNNYKDTFGWVFQQVTRFEEGAVSVDDDVPARAAEILVPLRELYQEVYKHVRTDDFQDELLKNNYFRQCFRVVKKLIQPSESNSGPDMRAYNSWELHLNKTGGPGQPSSSCPVLPPPYNFRTAFVDGMFPEDKTLPPALCIILFCSALHRGAAEGGGVFAAAVSSRARKTKGRKRNVSGDVVNEERDSDAPPTKYRLASSKNSKNPCANLSHLITAIVKAWDALAHSLLFRSCDVMLAPYLTFNMDRVQYESVPEGMLARSAQLHTLSAATTSPVDPSSEDCAPFASVFYKERDTSGRPRGQLVNPDMFLRELAALFVDQVYSQSWTAGTSTVLRRRTL